MHFSLQSTFAVESNLFLLSNTILSYAFDNIMTPDISLWGHDHNPALNFLCLLEGGRSAISIAEFCHGLLFVQCAFSSSCSLGHVMYEGATRECKCIDWYVSSSKKCGSANHADNCRAALDIDHKAGVGVKASHAHCIGIMRCG